MLKLLLLHNSNLKPNLLEPQKRHLESDKVEVALSYKHTKLQVLDLELMNEGRPLMAYP